MCPSLTEGLPSEEMRGYGVNIPSEICLGPDSCWLCHNPLDLRRAVFDKTNGNLVYMPVPCAASMGQ